MSGVTTPDNTESSLPTKAALLEAVLVRRFDRLREQAEALLDAGGDRDGDAARASDGLR